MSNLKFSVTVVETLEKELEIKASSSEEALSKIKERYEEQGVILSDDDWSSTTIRIFEEDSGALLKTESI